MADVFVSYSRRDSEFVRELHAFLTGEGRDVWVDWEDIPAASRWEQDIDESIDAAESFVFVVSTSSLASEYCGEEFHHAQERGKRVVPIALDGADPAAAPEGLRQLNWIWVREGDDRAVAFARLAQALDTDLEWARAHTRLLVRAVEWDARQDSSLLLRGRDLDQAEDELAANAANEPRPTELQQRYVHASRRGASRRQRLVLGSVLVALAVSVALGVAALLQRNEANDRARVARSQALAAQSVEALSAEPATALARGIAALETSPTPQARVALRRALLANPIEYVIPAPAKAAATNPYEAVSQELSFGSDGIRLLGLTPDRVLHLWRAAGGRPLATVPRTDDALLGPGGRVLSARGRIVRLDGPAGSKALALLLPAGERAVGLGFAGSAPLALAAGRSSARVVNVATRGTTRLRAPRVTDASFSDDGSRVVTTAPDAARAWDARTGRLLATLPPGPRSTLSPDGRWYAANLDDLGFFSLWAVDGGRRVGDLGEAARAVFSPDGRQVLTVGPNGDGTVWETRSARPVVTLPGFGGIDPGAGRTVSSFRPGAAFSADGRLVAIASPDGIVRVWELATRKQVGAVDAGLVNTLAFAPRGERLAAMTWNGDVVVAAPVSIPLRTGFTRDSCYPEFAPVVSSDGRRVVAPAAGGRAGVWSVDGRLERMLRPPSLPRQAGVSYVSAAALSRDGTTAAAASDGNNCMQFQNQRHGTVVERLRGGGAPQRLWTTGALALDPDGSLVTIDRRAFRTETGAPVPALDGVVAFAPGGGLALAARGGRAVIVAVPSGREVGELEAVRLGPFASAAFSPDGRRALVLQGDLLRLFDTATGEAVARVGEPGEPVTGYAFGDGGRLVLAVLGNRAATFLASSGEEVASLEGVFQSISDDGSLAARGHDDGTVAVVELDTGLPVSVQAGTGKLLVSAAFGPSADLIVARDSQGDVHVVRCEVCASDDDVLARARERLAIVSGYEPKMPPASGVA